MSLANCFPVVSRECSQGDVFAIELCLLCLELLFRRDRERLVQYIQILELERTGQSPSRVQAGRQALYDHHRYSAAVRSDGFLFVSGTVGSREDGSPEPDFEQQVRLAFSNLQAILHAAGASLDDIVDVTSFHTDPERSSTPCWPSRTRSFLKHPIRPGPRSA